MKNRNYVIYQSGCTIAGIGRNLAAAIEDAKKYGFECPERRNIELEDNSNNEHGRIYYAFCNDSTYDYLAEHGANVDTLFTVDRGSITHGWLTLDTLAGDKN